jgi:hypothetical protein
MTRDPKLPPDEAWDAVEKTALGEEAERVAKLSDAALDAELGKNDVDAQALRERGAALAAKLMAAKSTTATAEPAKAPAAATATVPRPVPRRSRRTVWLAAAALVAISGLLYLMTVPAVVAWFRPEPIAPDREQIVSARERAWRLREEGLASCRASLWTTCLEKLDQAMGLDPAGEADPRVAKARKEAAEAALVDAAPDKPIKH